MTAVEDRQSEFLVLYNQRSRCCAVSCWHGSATFTVRRRSSSRLPWSCGRTLLSTSPSNLSRRGRWAWPATKPSRNCRRQKTVPVFASPAVMEVVATAAAEMAPELAPRRNALAACLKKLSSSFRKLVGLYYGQGFSIVEVARATGRPRGSVEVSLWRARQQLAHCTRRAWKGTASESNAIRPPAGAALRRSASAEEEQALEQALLSDGAAHRRFVELNDQEAATRIVEQGTALAQQYSRAPLCREQSPRVIRSDVVAKRSPWAVLAGAAAAAAILLAAGVLFLRRNVSPEGSFGNDTDAVVQKSLADGTQLAVAPARG